MNIYFHLEIRYFRGDGGVSKMRHFLTDCNFVIRPPILIISGAENIENDDTFSYLFVFS